MKWLGGGEGDGIIKVDMDRGPHRTQDDAAVGYVFQRPPDPEFPSFGPKQLRWTHGDDSFIDVSIFYSVVHLCYVSIVLLFTIIKPCIDVSKMVVFVLSFCCHFLLFV